MKILFLLDNFPPISNTGASVVTYNLSKELLKKGHKIFVITSVQDKKDEKEEEYRGIKIFRIYSNYHVRWRAWLSLYNPKVVSKIEKIIKELKPDVSHIHHIHSYLSYHSFRLAKKYSKSVFLTAHDAMTIHYGKIMPKNGNCFYKIGFRDQIKEAKRRYNPFRDIIIKYYLKHIDKIFAVSDAIRKFLEINDIKNIITIYNGMDVDDWKANQEEINLFRKKYNLQGKRIILFGGRLSGAKGGGKILEAMVLVKKEVDNIVLLVVGKENQYFKLMEKMTEKLYIKKNVKFVGGLDRDEMKKAFFISDICVTPSICLDPFPTVNLEAMASKKPVIGTCFGGTPEIVVNNKTGYIVNPLNIKEMSEKIIDLLKNPQKVKQFGDMGYERVKNQFSLSKQVDEILIYYKKFTGLDD